MTDNEMIERLNKGEGFDYDDIIDLINRQKAEKETMQSYIDCLKAEIERLTTEKENLRCVIEDLSNNTEHAKAEAIKEFAERLKNEASEKVGIDEDFLYYDFDNKFKTFDSVVDVIEFLSAIVVKGMVGDNNVS